MTTPAPMPADELDALAARPVVEFMYGSGRVTWVGYTPAERDALITAARENSRLTSVVERTSNDAGRYKKLWKNSKQRAIHAREQRDTLAAREAELRQALTDLLSADQLRHRQDFDPENNRCKGCRRPWPCPAERARVLLDGGPT